jgi:hypothetical protein
MRPAALHSGLTVATVEGSSTVGLLRDKGINVKKFYESEQASYEPLMRGGAVHVDSPWPTAERPLVPRWFQPLHLSSEKPVSRLCFQMQLVPLHCGEIDVMVADWPLVLGDMRRGLLSNVNYVCHDKTNDDSYGLAFPNNGNLNPNVVAAQTKVGLYKYLHKSLHKYA